MRIKENEGGRGHGKDGTNAKEIEKRRRPWKERDSIMARVANQEGWRERKDSNKLGRGSACLLQRYEDAAAFFLCTRHRDRKLRIRNSIPYSCIQTSNNSTASLTLEKTIITKPANYTNVHRRSEIFKGSRCRKCGVCSALVDHTEV